MIGGLIDEAKTAIKLLLAISVLLLWIISQHHDIRFDALNIARDCGGIKVESSDNIVFSSAVKRIKAVVAPAEPAAVEQPKEKSGGKAEYEFTFPIGDFIDSLVLDSAIAASKTITFDDLKLFLKTETIGDDAGFSKLYLSSIKSTAAKLVALKPEHMRSDETVFDLWQKSKPRVQVPFVPESVDADSAVGLIGVLLLGLYAYLYSSMFGVLARINDHPADQTRYSMLCHSGFIGAIIAYGTVLCPACLWIATGMSLRLHEDPNSMLGESKGLVYGIIAACMIVLASAVMKRVWLLRLWTGAAESSEITEDSPLFNFKKENDEPDLADIWLLVPNQFAVLGTRTGTWLEFLASCIWPSLLSRILLVCTYALLHNFFWVPIGRITRQIDLPLWIAYWFVIRTRSYVVVNFRYRVMDTSFLGSGSSYWRPMLTRMFVVKFPDFERWYLRVNDFNVAVKTIAGDSRRSTDANKLQAFKSALDREGAAIETQKADSRLDEGNSKSSEFLVPLASSATATNDFSAAAVAPATTPETQAAPVPAAVCVESANVSAATNQPIFIVRQENKILVYMRDKLLPYALEVGKHLFLAAFCLIWGYGWGLSAFSSIHETGIEIRQSIGATSTHGALQTAKTVIFEILSIAACGVFGIYLALAVFFVGLVNFISLLALLVPVRPMQAVARFFENSLEQLSKKKT